MANTRFQAKRTSTSGLLPNTTNSGNLSYIAAGEFAVNLTDKKVLSSNGTQTFEVGANLSSLAVTTIVANGYSGGAYQVLSSNGTSVYWAAAANASTMNTYTFTITSNTTVITGLDTTSNTLVYTAGFESVFINGSRQISGVDYNTTNTTVLTLTENAVAGDIVQVTTLNALIGSGWGGSNTQVIFNDSGSANGSSSFTFNKTTTTLAVGSNVTVNTSTIFLGNSTVNTTIVAGNVNLQGTQLKVGNVVVNGNQLVIGNVTITDTQITVGNSTVNTVLSSTGSLSGKTLAAGNTSITGFANVSTSVNSALLTVGTSFIANTTGAYHTGTMNAASHTVGTSLIANSIGVYHTGTMNAASHTVGTSFIANTTQVTIAAGVKLSANGGVGTAGQVLSSNGSTGSPYWATVAAGGGGVTTFDGGSTGLSPYSASNGAVSLGGTLNVGYGGTGTNTYPSNGQLLIGTSGGGYAVANLTAGSGVSITKGSGTITIAATGGGGGGPYISYIQFQDGSYYNNGPSNPQQSPVVYWDSGLNQASLWFYSPTGGHNISAGSTIAGGITVQDNNGSYTFYTSGTDFSSSVSRWDASGYVVGIYGLGVTNVTLRALMANTAAQLGSPAIAPRGTNIFSQSTIYASVSGGINSSYYSGGRPIIVTPGYSNGYYGIYFNSGSPTSDSGLSLSYLTIDNNLGTGSYTYYAGTDFSVSSAGNDSFQQFSCQIYSVSNTTLSTLLDNTIIN